MTRIEITIDPLTCDDQAHADRVAGRVRIELPGILVDAGFSNFLLDVRGCSANPARRLEPVWLPDTDPDDPDFDRLADLVYLAMSRIRDEEEA